MKKFRTYVRSRAGIEDPRRPGARARSLRRLRSGPAAGRRIHSIDAEVVAAVLEGLRLQGYRGVTIEGIALKVKRARTSLYRRWPSKRHLVADAVVAELGAQPAPDTGSLRKDLKAAVGTLLTAFSGTMGKALPGLVADMALDPVLARMIREKCWRRGGGRSARLSSGAWRAARAVEDSISSS